MFEAKLQGDFARRFCEKTREVVDESGGRWEPFDDVMTAPIPISELQVPVTADKGALGCHYAKTVRFEELNKCSRRADSTRHYKATRSGPINPGNPLFMKLISIRSFGNVPYSCDCLRLF